MIENVPQVAANPDAKPAPDPSTAPGPTRTTAQPGTRVYVDQDGSGVYVYRLVDVATGRVLVELPRDRAEELKSSPDYAAGALVFTSA